MALYAFSSSHLLHVVRVHRCFVSRLARERDGKVSTRGREMGKSHSHDFHLREGQRERVDHAIISLERREGTAKTLEDLAMGSSSTSST